MVTSSDWLRAGTRARNLILAGVAAIVLGVGQAGPSTAETAHTTPAPPGVSAPVISPNWSGYVVTGRPGSRVSYSSATGTWKEPAVTCAHGDRGAFSTIAVGLGGYGADRQSAEQVGADANCGASGNPAYYAWFDLAPYPSHTIPQKVSPGDTLTATVSIIGTTRPPLVEVQVTNVTRGWSYTRRISWVSAGQFIVAPGEQNAGGLTAPASSSAEWLVEAPSTCQRLVCAQASLANFSSVAMTKVSAVAGGTTGTLADPDWKVTRLRLAPGPVRIPSYPRSTPFARNPAERGTAASPAGATPGLPGAAGRGFRVKWVPVAKGVV